MELKMLGILIVLIGLIDEGRSKGEKDGKCKWAQGHHHCGEGYSEIYRDGEGRDASRWCCTTDSDKAKDEAIKAIGCRASECFAADDDQVKKATMCTNFDKRWIDGKIVDYREILHDVCVMDKDDDSDPDVVGRTALCCPKRSNEEMLTLILGAEWHQFPHYASLLFDTDNGGTSFCGGTIYNEQYIITASHCIIKGGVQKDPAHGTVYLDVRMSPVHINSPNKYELEELIPHPNTTRWDESLPLKNDVALLKLKNKITFTDYIKPLPIADNDFDPFLYGNETLLTGIGETDTLKPPHMLQRTRTYLRMYKRKNKRGKNRDPGLLLLGGIQDGKSSPRSGPGDSGGPAICRDKDGYAVLCGINSSGPTLATCEEAFDEDVCGPLNYMRVSYYSDWIKKVAGAQTNPLKQKLFGEPVPDGSYPHQVRVASAHGPPCGGTLIKKDLVLTAAHCVVHDNKGPRSGLAVFTGIRDLAKDTGNKLDVETVQVLDGFKADAKRRKRIARLNTKPTPKFPFYQNDLAVLKLKTKADVDEGKLPQIGVAPSSDGDLQDVTWTTEVSLPNQANTGDTKLQQRDFSILEYSACQNRLNRAGFVGADITLDNNVMCGEERYNGGAQCDRELGGGLICKGSKGEDILCGVQTFRFCQLALPSGFFNVSMHQDWINEMIK